MKLDTIDTLLNKLSRDYPLQEEPNELDIIDWVREAYPQIDHYGQWEQKTLKIKIDDHRAFLPADFYSLDFNKSTLSHRIQGKQIVVQQKTGFLTLRYLAFPTDPIDGRPLIPDTPEYKAAFTHYCASKMYSNGTMIETQNKNEESEYQKWLWKKLEARADANLSQVQNMQQVADNFRTFNVFNTNPEFPYNN